MGLSEILRTSKVVVKMPRLGSRAIYQRSYFLCFGQIYYLRAAMVKFLFNHTEMLSMN
ncbi:hypothetical protein EBME_1395 [bacterium endosymbiont of Mortierella elongata FMR23-6]|nr:hypothetical protein EBME_1395 [bacterium endosymbiont of Mortierella elongata FMR23-6]